MARILFAVEDEDEIELFRATLRDRALDWSVIVPTDVREIDRLVNEGSVDLIVTDFQFQKGGFAEWLYLWQHPYVVLADWNEYEKLTEIVIEQTSDFIIRHTDRRHIEFLPLVIDKVLHNVESVERHNVTLRLTEERYMQLVNALPDIVYSLDGDGNFVYVNESIQGLGYEPSSLIGKHFSEILHESSIKEASREHVLAKMSGQVTGDENAPKLFDERRTGDRRTRDLEVVLKPGTSGTSPIFQYGSVISYGEVNATGFAPTGNDLGEPGSVGIIRDITHRKETEQLLRQSLNEKETLLSEIHHRVKNNLQVISSLLNLQSGAISDTEALRRFAAAQIQIQSMALVHQHLYRSKSFRSVNMAEYVENLCENLMHAFAIPTHNIALKLDIEPLSVPMEQAMPVALLLNELISNCIKHAFPDGTDGTVTIRLAEVEGSYVDLHVADDGVGIAPGSESAGGSSLGMSLITGLAAQLEGEYSFTKNDGTLFSLRFPLIARFN